MLGASLISPVPYFPVPYFPPALQPVAKYGLNCYISLISVPLNWAWRLTKQHFLYGGIGKPYIKVCGIKKMPCPIYLPSRTVLQTGKCTRKTRNEAQPQI